MRFIEANTLYARGDVLRCESAPWRSQGEALLCADWEPSSNSREALRLFQRVTVGLDWFL